MKKHWLEGLGVALLGAVLAIVSVPGEAGELRCDVPFRFEVRDKTLPAGTYSVDALQTTLTIRGRSTGALAFGSRVESKTNDTPKLVFHRYGDEYVLREVWTGRSGYKLAPSRHEGDRKSREVATFETVVIPLS